MINRVSVPNSLRSDKIFSSVVAAESCSFSVCVCASLVNTARPSRFLLSISVYLYHFRILLVAQNLCVLAQIPFALHLLLFAVNTIIELVDAV